MKRRSHCWVSQGVRGLTLLVVAQHTCNWRARSDGYWQARPRELQQSALQSSTEAGLAEDALERFVEWLVANGVRGVGGEDSNVALYEEERGMRGVICLKVVCQGHCAILGMDQDAKKIAIHLVQGGH